MVVDINGFQLDANAPFRTAFETIVQLVSGHGFKIIIIFAFFLLFMVKI